MSQGGVLSPRRTKNNENNKNDLRTLILTQSKEIRARIKESETKFKHDLQHKIQSEILSRNSSNSVNSQEELRQERRKRVMEKLAETRVNDMESRIGK